ncbi:MAG: PEP-utilizing enzyme, partial [Hyphomicrobiales bacterium]
MTDEVVGFGQGGSRSIKLAIKNYGAKAARLAAMASSGLVVPPSVALPISACRNALANDGNVSVSFQVDISRGVRGLQRTTRKWLGDKENPLILAVRVSPANAQGGLGLPVVFIGWTEEAIALLPTDEKKQKAAQQLANTVRELASNVFNVDEYLFDEKLEEAEEAGDIDWLALHQTYLDIVKQNTEESFPVNPSDQLMLAVRAVWHSWRNPKAVTYRQLYDIEDVGGIGVLIQVCVPWNDAESVSQGWIAVRCENTGGNKVFGEIYSNDSSVAPMSLAENSRKKIAKDIINQASIWETQSARAEKLYFIIADEKAFIIDGDPLPMSTAADVTFAVEMVNAGAISKMDAVQRIDPSRLIDILHARLEPDQSLTKLVSGLSASPGAATGRVVFSASAAEALKSKGWQVILVKAETAPEDIRGMQASSAIVTIRGGLTSHAAVIARGTGKPCIVSLSGVQIDAEEKTITIGEKQINEGDYITVDGSTGVLYDGKCALRPSEVSGDLSILLEWADEYR